VRGKKKTNQGRKIQERNKENIKVRKRKDRISRRKKQEDSKLAAG
jgi:hypothetical protein